jgi:predicted O-methyltransferase YrrM
MTHTIPPLVSQALGLAADRGFERSCTEEVGRLLHLLAGHQRTGIIGEIGTGYGVGAAWMATALQPGVSLVTVEADEEAAAQACELLHAMPAARVLHADWRAILVHGPFTLLFVDASELKRGHPDELIEALQPGGIIVLDDLTPIEAWSPEWHDTPDPIRDFWLHDPRLISLEIRLTPTMAAILATRSG